MDRSLFHLSDSRVLVLDSGEYPPAALLDGLRTLGVSRVTRTLDAAGVLPMLRQGQFDVAIVDLDGESPDGIDFIKCAAEREGQAIILMASHDEELLASVIAFARGRHVNVLGTLPKPVALSRLAKLLASRNVRNEGVPNRMSGKPYCGWRGEDLVKALDGQQFIPFFQPQIELATGRLTSVEVLARWNHPDLGVLPPSQFIDVMEQSGLIDRLFDSLLRQSLAHAQQWDRRGSRIGLAINVSPLTLQNAHMPNLVSEMVRAYGMHPARVTLEVTETAMTQDPDQVLETAIRLRLRGFKLSVDDFGTGYSSLQQLSEMPFTEIKIDRALVAGISGSRKSAAILESIVHLADKLGMCTVAEGIETKEDRDLLRTLGCRYGQAYYFAMPMANADLVGRLDHAGA